MTAYALFNAGLTALVYTIILGSLALTVTYIIKKSVWNRELRGQKGVDPMLKGALVLIALVVAIWLGIIALRALQRSSKVASESPASASETVQTSAESRDEAPKPKPKSAKRKHNGEGASASSSLPSGLIEFKANSGAVAYFSQIPREGTKLLIRERPISSDSEVVASDPAQEYEVILRGATKCMMRTPKTFGEWRPCPPPGFNGAIKITPDSR